MLAHLRSRAWLVPWLLVAIVLGASIASAQRGSAPDRLEPPHTAATTAHAAGAGVRCELRHGFVQRLVFTTHLMARSLLPNAQQRDHAPGITCQTQAP